jgi:hypothetical protein
MNLPELSSGSQFLSVIANKWKITTTKMMKIWEKMFLSVLPFSTPIISRVGFFCPKSKNSNKLENKKLFSTKGILKESEKKDVEVMKSIIFWGR